MLEQGMDIRQFEYVRAIAQEGSLARAAAKLHISAPTLSQFLTRLEGELGLPLFVRSRLGVEPTAAGQAYLEGAEAILRIQGETLERLERMKKETGRLVRVGVSPGRSEALFTDFMPAFMAAHPGAEVRMVESPMPQLDELLRSGGVDFSLALLHFTDSSLAGECYHAEELVFALSARHPARRLLPPPGQGPLEPERLAALAAWQFIVSKPGYRLRDAADFYFAAAGFAPRQPMESSQIDQVCQLLRSRAGLGFIPRDAAASCPDLATYALSPALRLEFGIQLPKGRAPSGYGRSFVQELRAYVQASRPTETAQTA